MLATPLQLNPDSSDLSEESERERLGNIPIRSGQTKSEVAIRIIITWSLRPFLGVYDPTSANTVFSIMAVIGQPV